MCVEFPKQTCEATTSCHAAHRGEAARTLLTAGWACYLAKIAGTGHSARRLVVPPADCPLVLPPPVHPARRRRDARTGGCRGAGSPPSTDVDAERAGPAAGTHVLACLHTRQGERIRHSTSTGRADQTQHPRGPASGSRRLGARVRARAQDRMVSVGLRWGWGERPLCTSYK